MPVEKTTIPLPKGYDPTVRAHQTALAKIVEDKLGAGWEVGTADVAAGVVHLTRRTLALTVSAGKEITLPFGTKESDGPRIAARNAELYPGYHLTRFNPHLGTALLERKNEAELRCREVVATALRVKPWEVQVEQRKDGGFAVQLPGRYNHTQAEQDKLQELAENVVGRLGWYVETDPRTLVAQIIPAEPPTFPNSIPFPLKKLGHGTLDRIEFGMKLPRNGQKSGDPAVIDWTMSPYLLLGGLPRSGKSVSLRDIIADAVSNGSELVICTTKDKSVDFTWAKPFVRDGGWGCEGHRSAVTALKLAHEDLKKRADVLKERGIENWMRIPEQERFKPILCVVDEVSMMMMTDKLPSGVDRKSPEVQAILELNMIKFRLYKTVYDIMAEMGFVGARVILSSQVTNAATGLPPTIKALMGNKALQGSNPSKAQRDQAFNVAASVPVVPENLRGGGMAAKGVGAAEFEGQEPFVYKPYFLDEADAVPILRGLGVRSTSRPEPTEAEMDRLCPLFDDGDDLDGEVPEPMVAGEVMPSGRPASSIDPKFLAPVVLDDNGRPLKGAALAAAQSRRITEATGHAQLCPHGCGQPIAPDGSCGCA